MPSLQLDQTHQECKELEEFTAAFLRQVTESYRQSRNNEGGKTFLNGTYSGVCGLTVLLKGPCC